MASHVPAGVQQLRLVPSCSLVYRSCAVLHPQHDHAQHALQVLQLGRLLAPPRLLRENIAAQGGQAHLQMSGMLCSVAVREILTALLHALLHRCIWTTQAWRSSVSLLAAQCQSSHF